MKRTGERPKSLLNSVPFASSWESLISLSSESIPFDNGMQMVMVGADISGILKSNSPPP